MRDNKRGTIEDPAFTRVLLQRLPIRSERGESRRSQPTDDPYAAACSAKSSA